MRKHLVRSVALAAALMGSAQAWALSLQFDLASPAASVGDALLVQVRVTDLPTSVDLATFDLNVLFDTTALQFNGYTLGNGLGDLNAFEAMDLGTGHNGTGQINLAEVSLLDQLSSQANGFTLATLSFKALVPGLTTLSFGAQAVLGDTWGNALNATTSSATVNVSAVPEPAGVLAAMAGLGLLWGVRRRVA